MLPRRKPQHYFHHVEEREKHAKHRVTPRADPVKPFWEDCTDKWTKDLDGQAHSVEQIVEMLFYFAKAASDETIKGRQAFIQFANEKMGDQDIEKSLRDYRNCVVPVYITEIYERLDSYRVDTAIAYAFLCSIYYFHCFDLMVQSGCPYKKELLEHAKSAQTYCHQMGCMLNRAKKFFKMAFGFKGKIETPEYLTKNTGDYILFIRDYMIIRDFNELCNKLTMTLIYNKRKLWLHSGKP